MSILKRSKNLFLLRTHTDYVPTKLHEVRWTGTRDLIVRAHKFKDALQDDSLEFDLTKKTKNADGEDITENLSLPDDDEWEALQELAVDLEEIYKVTKVCT